MSILLDSLRKSEAQRKIGDTPSIYSTQEYQGENKSGSGWVIWLLIGLTAAAITWFGWQQFGVFDSDQAIAQAEPAVPASAASETSPDLASGSETAAAQRTPVERFTEAESAENPAPIETDPVTRVAEFVADENRTESEASNNEINTGEEAAPAIDQALEVSLEDVVAEQAEAQARIANGSENQVDSAPGKSAVSRSSSRSPNRDVEPQPQSYWQLPQSIRDDLPEFRITVLVYAENPEDRFLLLNGERLREQDELEGGVVLEEIRRDGAVFAYGSRSFLVKN